MNVPGSRWIIIWITYSSDIQSLVLSNARGSAKRISGTFTCKYPEVIQQPIGFQTSKQSRAFLCRLRGFPCLGFWTNHFRAKRDLATKSNLYLKKDNQSHLHPRFRGCIIFLLTNVHLYPIIPTSVEVREASVAGSACGKHAGERADRRNPYTVSAVCGLDGTRICCRLSQICGELPPIVVLLAAEGVPLRLLF